MDDQGGSGRSTSATRRASVQRVVLRTARQARRRLSGPTTASSPGSACAAPFTSMYLDQMGNVRACCQNTDHTLGNVTSESLTQIWNGERTAELRAAMQRHDYSLGCQFCRWQIEDENENLVFARTFDHLSTDVEHPAWPQQLEMSLSNACNLQCVMCNGDWSSSIRTHREGRPPLPTVYDDAFFDDLRPFLHHVRILKILGGEPFLSGESLRVLEMLVADGLTPAVHVTTNGTQWSRRVERILESLPMEIVLSLDGCDAATYEAIRVGSNFETVMTNLDRFQDYAASHGGSVNLAHCLMTNNWHRFPDFLRFAESRRLTVYVNTVTYPVSMSLFHMSPTALRSVVEEYERADQELSSELQLNLDLWRDQLGRLRHRLDNVGKGENRDYYLGVEGFAWRRDPDDGADGAEGPMLDRARRLVTDDLGPGAATVSLLVDVDGRIEGPADGTSVDAEILGVPVSSLIGQHIDRLAEILSGGQGSATFSVGQVSGMPDHQISRMRLESSQAHLTGVTSAVRDRDGVIVGIALVIGAAAIDPDEDRDVDAEIEQEFRSGVPSDALVEVLVDPQGRITSIEPTVVLDDLSLDGLVGQGADQLALPFAERFGEVLEQDEVPVGGGRPTAAMGHHSSCGIDGVVTLRLRSVSIPLGGASREGNGSRILIALEPTGPEPGPR